MLYMLLTNNGGEWNQVVTAVVVTSLNIRPTNEHIGVV